ncbi:CDP-archaeol synthase [Nitrosomonas sp. Nm166]|uniref:CDP-archaeol synthase n=1 Tax=Nitrosomonas sp. Nm166 TaxID=1881054 RepID=UPI0008E72A1B|nr:CDP-archaeol synthase [Nitrosomonas sp. Nm166]SFE68010.1 CDP-2,3-bis-(O-geranylgeranyl)-sn-glycerol synthase [Nitrosomonas sp. Nm166]
MEQLQQEMILLVWLMGVNGAPILLAKLAGKRFNYPIDFNKLFFDGKPILGSSKTFRGLFSALLMSILIGNIFTVPLLISLLFGILSMAGDLTSSFIKRRLGLPPSSMALGLDQIPESLFPLLGCKALLGISMEQVVFVVLVFFVMELVLSWILFLFKIRKTPY